MYIRMSRFKLKPEAVEVVRKGYEKDVMAPVAAATGNRFFGVLLSAEEERVGSQVTGWESKEDCDRWLNEGAYAEAMEDWWWVFEERPRATFWNLSWPAQIQLDPLKPGPSIFYFRVSRHKLKPEAVGPVREHYANNVMPFVAGAAGNRFICFLNSAEEERVGSQVTAWDSKEDCDRFLNEGGYAETMKDWGWAFEEMPTATFWEMKWPARLQF